MLQAPVNNSASIIAGVDEAGRGPLAGPVVAAAVILNNADVAAHVADSKKLNARQREHLYEDIYAQAAAIGIGVVEAKQIDRLNILHATMLAMKIAIDELKILPTLVLVDGNRCPDCRWPVEAIVGGDDRVAEISAASIVAKVRRDRMMVKLHESYPQYGFDVHKGYPTKQHREALMAYGPIDEHRKTFAPVKKALSAAI